MMRLLTRFFAVILAFCVLALMAALVPFNWAISLVSLVTFSLMKGLGATLVWLERVSK